METSARSIATGVIVGGVLLAIGCGVGGFLAGRGVILSRLEDRFVTVKGVAEADARADLAILPIRFSVTASDLKAGMGALDTSTRLVTSYLNELGVKDSEVNLQRLEVQDAFAQGYRSGTEKNDTRFVLTQSLTIRSADIDLVTKISREIGELARRGVVLNDTSGPSYIMTAERLNEIKPGLIRKATEEARVAADEFAATSQSKVGGIRRANQGVIVILPRDGTAFETEYQSVDKRIRAVTTVDYFLARP
ncbi:MAG: SIMPL domain-containing protein [Alphaproteobacteria bacterium]